MGNSVAYLVFMCRRCLGHSSLSYSLSTFSFRCIRRILPKRILTWNMKWIVEGSRMNIKESFSLWIPRRIHLPQLYLSVAGRLAYASPNASPFSLPARHSSHHSTNDRYENITEAIWDSHDAKEKLQLTISMGMFYLFSIILFTHTNKLTRTPMPVIGFFSLHFINLNSNIRIEFQVCSSVICLREPEHAKHSLTCRWFTWPSHFLAAWKVFVHRRFIF